jgi:hypothetical protein
MLLLYICIYIYTKTHIYIHTNTQRQANKSMYQERHFVSNYGEMIRYTTREKFAAIARTQRQIHVIFLYIYIYTHTYIYIHTHTNTETGQQVNLPRTATSLQLRPNECNYQSRDHRCTFAPREASPRYSIYIYTHTNIYIYTHTHT